MTEIPVQVQRSMSKLDLFWARIVVRRGVTVAQRYVDEPIGDEIKAHSLALLIVCHTIHVAIDFERMAKGDDFSIIHDLSGIEAEMWKWPSRPGRFTFVPRFAR